MSEIRQFDDEAAPPPRPGETGARLERRVTGGGIDRKIFSGERALENRRVSLALHNLRGVAIAFLLVMHACLAYLASVASNGYAFSEPPYQWVAFPVLDSHRWLGLDIFCAWLDLYLMALMFFLSGLFTWPSLARDGEKKFLARRFAKLGAALLFGVAVVTPIALLPVYLRSTADPSFLGYARAYLNLPFIPNGPLWFLWVLLAFDLFAAVLHRFAPRSVAGLGRIAVSFEQRPWSALVWATLIAVVVYTPLALAFTPWRWSSFGPFALQLSRPALYAAFFVFGLVIGRRGLGKGLLSLDGILVARWRSLAGLAAGSLIGWMGLMGLALHIGDQAPAALQALADACYAFGALASVLFMLAAALRFGPERRPIAGAIADKALPIYVLHYAPIVWLQYGLLGLPLPAVVKAAIVFVGALTISWSLATGFGMAKRGWRRELARAAASPVVLKGPWPARRRVSE